MSIADKLQVLAENEQRISNEVGDQADLIAQISSVIDEKLAGGGEEPVNKLASVVDGTVTELTAEDLAGATKIRDYAFYHWESLTSVVLPDGVTSIGERAFSYCNVLNSVNFSNSVTKIGSLSFAYCKRLKTVTIPYSVTIIDTQAFWDCDSLTSVEFGNGIKTIASYSFGNCDALKRLDFSTHTQIPTLIADGFSNNSTLQIKVPANLIDEWKSATNWSNYADKIVTEFTNEV